MGNFGGTQPDDGKHAWERMAFQQVLEGGDGKKMVNSTAMSPTVFNLQSVLIILPPLLVYRLCLLPKRTN